VNALNKSGSQINGKEESRSRRASRGREKSRSRNGSGEVRRGWRRQGPSQHLFDKSSKKELQRRNNDYK
jgi:hypothetical protein